MAYLLPTGSAQLLARKRQESLFRASLTGTGAKRRGGKCWASKCREPSVRSQVALKGT